MTDMVKQTPEPRHTLMLAETAPQYNIVHAYVKNMQKHEWHTTNNSIVKTLLNPNIYNISLKLY